MSRNYFTSKNFKHLIWNSYIKTVLFIQGYFLEIFKTKSVWIFQLLYDGPAGGGSLYHKNHDRTLININICAHIHYPWSKKWQFFLKKSGYYTIRLVLYFKQNKHHSGQEKKIRVAIHKFITRYIIFWL